MRIIVGEELLLCIVVGEVMCTTMRGESEDVDLAISTARKAYESWSKLTPHQRARHIYRSADTRHLFSY